MAKNHPVAHAIQACGIAGLLSFVSSSASAAGFALIEQSVSSMGTAYAGAGSISEDASTVFFNPASMARLEGSQLSAGLHIVLPDSEFKGGGTYTGVPFPVPPGTTIKGGDGGNGGKDAVVPHFTYVHDINEKWNFGFSVNAPFGLATEYNKGWLGRYSAVESEIVSINLNPSLSFKVNEKTSVGFGLNAMYASLLLKNAIDDRYLTGGLACAPGGALGDPSCDGKAKLDEIDDWGFGFNVGVLLEPTDHTRLGLSYRSKVDIDLDGDLKATSAVALPKTSAKADVSLPDTVLVSAYHEITPKYAIMADVLWTHWSEIDELKIKLGTGSTNTFDLQWDNTVRVAIGGSYKHNERVTLRTGVAFDEGPTSNKELRLAALPDTDRIWLSFGAGYKHSDKLSFDFGYAHLFIDDPKINSTDAVSSVTGGGSHRLTGEFDADVDILSAQVNWKL